VATNNAGNVSEATNKATMKPRNQICYLLCIVLLKHFISVLKVTCLYLRGGLHPALRPYRSNLLIINPIQSYEEHSHLKA